MARHTWCSGNATTVSDQAPEKVFGRWASGQFSVDDFFAFHTLKQHHLNPEHQNYPLVSKHSYRQLSKMAPEIVDLPIKNADFP